MTNVTPIHPLNGPMEQTPAELGGMLAQRMQEMPFHTYLPALDEVLGVMRRQMQAGGRPLPAVYLICREIQGEAISTWISIWIARRAQEARENKQRRAQRKG
jgi:hypothetical protein